jgi:hypothetical protein
MKKIYTLLLYFILLFLSIVCNAQTILDFENHEYYFNAYYDDLSSPPFVFSFLNKTFYIDIPELDPEKVEQLELIKGNIQFPYHVDVKNGFTYINAGNKKYLVLYNNSLLCILIDCSNNDAFFGLNKNSKYIHIGEYRNFIGITGFNSLYNNPRVSSFLVETINGKKIEYNGRHENYYYELTRPWVEGVKGYGIGEWIEMEVANNIDEIVFFNGYIDPNRPDLYYSNSRVKEITITAGNEDWILPIKDTPNPQVLKLNKLVSGRIRFTINSVYEGSRYADTCIAGIYLLHVRGQ